MHTCVLSHFSCVYSATPWTVAHQATWDSLGKNTGVGSHALFQGIFPTQGWNWHLLCLLHGRWILYRWAAREAPLPLLKKKKKNSHRFQLPEKWLLPSPLISFCTLLALSWSTNDKGLLFFKCIMITPPPEFLLTVSSTWNASFYPNHLMWLYASLWFSILLACIVFKSWPKNSSNNVFFNAFFPPLKNIGTFPIFPSSLQSYSYWHIGLKEILIVE